MEPLNNDIVYNKERLDRNTIEIAVTALSDFIFHGTTRSIEPIRLAKAGYVLLSVGCSVRGSFPGGQLSQHLILSQQTDGGWADVEETLWCLGYLAHFGSSYAKEISKGNKWLMSVKLPCGAWGRSNRDQPRIPVTALASIVVPEVVNTNSIEWITNCWEADLNGPTPLTYKGAFFLLSRDHGKLVTNDALIKRTITYLENEQSDDGGFGPWKGHPVGSDPWSTGIVLWGLSTIGKQAPRSTIERAISWLESKQLPNGFWPYHYLDNGTAMALIGISSVLPLFPE